MKNPLFIPKLIISIYKLENVELYELEANNKDGEYTRIRKQAKAICDYTWDNSMLALSDSNGYLYSMSIYIQHMKGSPKYWDITIWDIRGTQTILSFDIEYKSTADKLSKEDLKKIKDALSSFVLGTQNCGDCKRTMPTSKEVIFTPTKHQEKYGGQYFAARYCLSCWERKHKAIEANENYN
jgi:hypothetical protein